MTWEGGLLTSGRCGLLVMDLSSTRVFPSRMGRGTVDQGKMWFAGMDLSTTLVFLSHMGRGTVDQCQWKMWFAGDGPIPHGEGPFL